MHVFIIAAISSDGCIAKTQHHPAVWTSKEDKKRFVQLTKRAGVVIMGSTTFQTLPRPLKDRLMIVYSRSQKFEGVETTSDNPKELLKKLETRGFTEVAICGGSEIYSLFMEAGVVDSIYLSIEPIMFGTGIHLFKRSLEEINLLLQKSSTHQNGTVFLDYTVVKK